PGGVTYFDPSAWGPCNQSIAKQAAPAVKNGEASAPSGLRDWRSCGERSLVRQVLQAALGRNRPQALNLSRELAGRYPRSAGAQILRGYFAIDVQQYAEATTALHNAIAIQPQLTLAHFGLALIEGKQNHFAAA